MSACTGGSPWTAARLRSKSTHRGCNPGTWPSADAHGFVTDVVLLDQPGQLVGFWASQLLDRGFVVLPSRMKSLQLFGPTPPAGRALRCNARIARIGDQQLRSTLEIVEPDGRVW